MDNTAAESRAVDCLVVERTGNYIYGIWGKDLVLSSIGMVTAAERMSSICLSIAVRGGVNKTKF
jgi:hypothetical protein